MKNFLMPLCITLIIIVLYGCNNYSYVINTKELRKEDAKEFIIDKVTIETINSIDIRTKFADIEIIEDDNYNVEIFYYYWEEAPSYNLNNGHLSFNDDLVYPESYSINFSIYNYIKIYLPKGADLDHINLTTSSGDISLSAFIAERLDTNISYGSLTINGAATEKANIRLSSGNCDLINFNVGTLNYTNSYGNTTLTNINTLDIPLPNNATYQKLDVTMSSGDCTINGLETDLLKITNSYGQVTCSNLMVDSFDSTLSSGNLTITKSEINDITVKNSFGAATLSLKGERGNYNLDLETSFGSVILDGESYERNYSSQTNGGKRIKATLSSGDVIITFNQ